MEDKELNELNDAMDLPEDGSQPDFDAVDEQIEKDFERVDAEIDEGFERADKMGDEFDAMGDEMEAEFDQLGDDLGKKMEAAGEKLEKKMESFGEEMERVGEKIEDAFGDAFQDVDENGDRVFATVDKSEKTVNNHARGGGQAIFWGFAMIAVGAFVILQQLGMLNAGYNWWAIFILVPGFGFLSGALDMLISKGRISSGVRSMIGSGVLVLTVGTILLFDLDWAIFWPLTLIAVGFSMFLNGFAGKKDYKGLISRWTTRFGLWTGLAAMGLGAAFLLKYLGIFSMSAWYSEWALQFTSVTDGWWGLFLLLPGIGGLLHAVIIILTTRRFPFGAIGLAVTGIACLTVGIVASLGLKWNLIVPFIVVGSGMVIVLGEFLHQIVRTSKSKKKVDGNKVEGKIIE